MRISDWSSDVCSSDLATVTHYLDTELEALKVDQATDPSPTSGFQRVVQRAILHVQSSGRDEVTGANVLVALRSEEHTSELQSLMRISYAVFCLKKKNNENTEINHMNTHNKIQHL